MKNAHPVDQAAESQVSYTILAMLRTQGRTVES